MRLPGTSSAMPMPSIRSVTTISGRVLSGLRIDRRAIDRVAARRIAAVGPVEDAAFQIEFEIDRFGQVVEEDLDVAAVGRRLAFRNVDAGAQDAADSCVVRPFCVQ